MIRLAVVLLAGATFVAAQTTTTEDVAKTQKGRMNADSSRQVMKNDSARQVMDQLREKLRDASKCDSGAIDKAREAAKEYRKQICDKTGAEADSMMEQRRSERHDRIQGAIDAMERRGDKAGSQVKEVSERTQIRIAEKRQEMIDHQQKILERQEARKERTGKPEVEETTEETTEEETAE